MAVIIKGGEIPVDCLGCDEMVMLSQCPIHLNEPLKYCNGTRHPDCPIIGEIPDSHGRLIDVDKLIASFRKWANAPIKRTNKEIADFLEEYSQDSTIVEATE